MAPQTFNASSSAVWGPRIWSTIHTFAFAYERDDPSAIQRRAFYDFLTSVSTLLPCDECKRHMIDYMAASKMTSPSSSHLSNRKSVIDWTIKFHNDVNARLQKPQIGVDQVSQMYEGEYSCPTGAAGSATRDDVKELPMMFTEFCQSALKSDGAPPDQKSKHIAVMILSFIAVAAVVLLLLRRDGMT